MKGRVMLLGLTWCWLVACAPLAQRPIAVTLLPVFIEEFERGLEGWTQSQHAHLPAVWDQQIGRPAPSLLLPDYDMIAFQSGGYVILRDHVFSDGTIELDVYLDTLSLIDLVFRADPTANKGYIARFDSRGTYYDTFVKIDTWSELGSKTSHATSLKTWHHMKVEVEGPNFRLYNDGVLVAEATDRDHTSGSIALLNEGGRVYVDNLFIFPKETSTLPRVASPIPPQPIGRATGEVPSC